MTDFRLFELPSLKLIGAFCSSGKRLAGEIVSQELFCKTIPCTTVEKTNGKLVIVTPTFRISWVLFFVFLGVYPQMSWRAGQAPRGVASLLLLR